MQNFITIFHSVQEIRSFSSQYSAQFNGHFHYFRVWSLVTPRLMSFCNPLVWHFCGEENTKKIKKIQERALRFIYQDYASSSDTLLNKSQLPSLRVRRLRAIALEAFKILSNQTPVYLSDILTFKPHSYSFRYTNTVEVPQVRTSKYGVRPFRSTAAKMWNSLPQQFREINTVEQFRSQISTWSGGVCTCSFCSDC